MAARGDRRGDRWRTNVVLLLTAAVVAALSLAQPALAEDATGAPAPDVTSTAPATDPAPATAEPATPAPEPSPEPTPEPTPAPQDPPSSPPDSASEPTEPAPTEAPAGEVVTMEPAATEPCTQASGVEGAQVGTCEAAAAGTTAESPQAAPEQAESAPPSTATAPTVAATPTAPAHAAPVVLVVSLAPEQAAAVPAEAVAVAELDASTAEASVQEPWASLSDAPAIELADVPVHAARLAEGRTFPAGVADMWSVHHAPLPPLSTTPLAYPPIVNGVIATGTIVQGARASPRERDGHRVVATKAEEQKPPSAGAVPSGPLENHGLGASGGSAGGVPGAASSSRFFAIATTPLRFDFPSSFSHAPLPSRVPAGALEAAPTTRPG